MDTYSDTMTEQTTISKYTCTENGAIALDTSGSPIVDYFMMYTRSLTKEKNYELDAIKEERNSSI